MDGQPRFTSVPFDRVLAEEAAFANAAYAPYAMDVTINPAMLRKYQAPSALWDWRELAALLLGDVRGKQLLDIGCGMGEEAIYFAVLGAEVTAIDIADVGVDSVRRRAAAHGLTVHAHQMRVDPTTFPDASFDLVHGLGILHHVGIEAGLREVRRLLRPGGTAVFLEPLGDHAGVEALKAFLLAQAARRGWGGEAGHVTDHEHNLRWDEIERALRPFPRAATFPYHLLARARRFLPARWVGAARRLDHALLTLAPGLRRVAGAVVIAVGA